jgi:exocyst complex component 4
MNIPGCSKMQLNILVLQQNLKNVEPNATLTRSRLYFDLFSAGPTAIIAQAEKDGRGGQFSFDEMKALLQLYHSEGLRSERREANVAAQRGLEAQLLQLSEFMW